MQIFYVAHVETRHFDFEGYGSSPEEAVHACRRAWLKHKRQCPVWLRHQMFRWSELADDCVPQARKIGASYVDGSEI